jgi:hypothetical protein
VSGPFEFVILVVIGALIFYIGRRTSEGPAPNVEHVPPAPEPELPYDHGFDKAEAKEPAVVGNELPFPFESELEQLYNAGTMRADFLNYYFKETDLVSGPADPYNFVDEFSAEFENRDDCHKWIATYTVATPQGLSSLLAKDDYRYVLGDGMIIIPRYDLATVLRAVLDLHNGTTVPEEAPPETAQS